MGPSREEILDALEGVVRKLVKAHPRLDGQYHCVLDCLVAQAMHTLADCGRMTINEEASRTGLLVGSFVNEVE